MISWDEFPAEIQERRLGLNRNLHGRILDLGCGVGSYLEGALMAGCKDLLGLELCFDNAKPYITENILIFC